MHNRLSNAQRSVPVFLGVVTLACVALLLMWDAFPGLFPIGSHEILAALPLGMIAIVYIVYQIAHRPAAMEWIKAALLAIAFLFWAANQFWPALPQATLFNDFAIALFVLDVFLVIVGWPFGSADKSFAETFAGSGNDERL